MSTVMQLISDLGAAGIKVWLDEDSQLRFKAPKGALTPELKDKLLDQKENVIAFLQHSKTDQNSLITPVERNHEQLYPLSFAQQRFWFLDRLEPGNPSLHITAALRIRGNLNQEWLRLSFEYLVAQHDSLRTAFITIDNKPLQKIHDPMPWALHESHDISHLHTDDQGKRLREIMDNEALKPFNLNDIHSSLLRTSLVYLGRDESSTPEHVLLITLHHIIADGWSLGLLIEELTGYYQSLQHNLPRIIKPHEISYIDFSAWQSQRIESAQIQNQLAYWKQQLNSVAVLELPTDFQRRNNSTHHGDSIRFTIPSELSSELKNFAIKEQSSVFILLLAAFQLLLHRHTRQDDICVGTPVAGRNQQSLEPVIGCFINLLAIRSPINPSMNFSQFLAQVKNTLLAAQENQDIPFELVAEACTDYRSLAHTPLFQALFTHQASNLGDKLHIDHLHLELLPQTSLTTKYDIQLHIDNDDNNFIGTLEYNRDLFLKATLEDFSRHYVNLLGSICHTKDTAINTLGMLDDIDMKQLVPLSQPVIHSGRNLLEELNHSLKTYPHNIAIRCGKYTLSYEELDKRANAVAQLLASNHVKPGERVGLCFNAGIDFMVALIGTIKAGACYVPMDIQYPEERLTYMNTHASMQALLIERSIAPLFKTAPNVFIIETEKLIPCDSFPSPEVNPEQAFYIIYTSGSTGLPKGACVSYRNEANLLQWYISQYNMRPTDKILVISALGFDLTQKNLLAPLLCGAEVVFTGQSYEPRQIVDTINTEHITFVNCAPSAFYPLVELCVRHQHIEHLATLRHVLFGGEPIVLENLKGWITHNSFNTQITNMYGPTECTDITCAYTLKNPPDYFTNSVTKHNSANIPIGKTIQGVETYVLDENRQLLPIGVAGELYIGGISVGMGYFNNPEMTSGSFFENPFTSGKLYRTQDIARYIRTDDGLQLEFLSRSDDQVKIRGFRIEPGEIASCIMKIGGIKDALVISKKDHNGIQKLLAYYISDSGTTMDLLDFRSQLKSTLPDYMIPGAFIDIEQWPLSANGKIDKKALPEPLAIHWLKSVYVAPRNIIETKLAEAWQTALGINNISIHDNFFELGGHSLIATRLTGVISQELGIDIPLKAFFEKPTIAELAADIERGNAIDALPLLADITPIDRCKDIPLSLAQQRLWIIEQLSPGNTAYNIPFALQIVGTLNKPALLMAMQAMVERHETLRTRIMTLPDGNACQDIRPPNEFILQETDAGRPLSANELQTLLSQTASRPFHFSTDILFNAQLLTINSQEHFLLCCMHHIISDGWSLAVFQQELHALYKAYASGQPSPLAALACQYADYAVWQREQMTLENTREHLDYWITHLLNAPAFITLPTDKPRPAQQTFNGAMLTLPIPDNLANRVAIYSQQHGTTSFNVLLSSYALLLGKYARQEDICIGTPVSGREKASLQGLIGYFVNAVVIRNNLSGNPCFDELVWRTQLATLGAFAHQDIAIEQVLDNLDLDRNPAYPPVAQVGFSFIGKAFTPELTIDNLVITPVDIERVVAKYDITFIIVETANGLQLNIEYNTDLFNADTIANLFRHYVFLLEQCLAQPATGTKAFNLLEHDELYSALNVTVDDVENIYPLTPMQYDMVLSQWLNPASLANTLGYRAEVAFEVDADIWQKALALVSQQQAVTRTRFKTNRLAYGDFAYQCVYRYTPVMLEVMDYSKELLSTEEIQQRVDAFIYQPQHYQEQQFIRYGLMRISGQRTILLLSSHHALLDGISIVVIAETTARYYEALQQQRPVNDIVFPPLTFPSYITVNIQHIDNTAARAFWSDRLSSCEAPDFPIFNHSANNRQIVNVHVLDKPLWRDIKSWSRKNRSTPAQLLKMVYGLLIANYCHTSADFYFSEFHAGRNKNNALSLGCFFQQSPFIFSQQLLKPETRISGLLDYAREFRKSIKAFDAISMGLTRQLAPQGRLHFMFNYYHFFPQNALLMGKPITCIETPPFIDNTVQFVIKEHEEECQLDLYYQSECFSDYRLLERIGLLCRQIVDGTDTIGALSLLFPDEIHQQVHEWNNTQHILPEYTSVHAWFEAQAALTPDNIAIIDDTGNITYRELNANANRIAHYLKQQGVGSDVRVGLCMNRNIHAITVILGIIKAGGAYVPIDPSYPAQRIRYMIDASKIHILFTETKHQAIFADAAATVVAVDDTASSALAAITKESTDNPSCLTQANDMLYVIFTSGSTGNPKGATVTHKGEINLLNWYTREFDFNLNSRCLIISALGFDLTQKNIFAPLVSGGTLVLSSLEHYDSGAIHDLIKKHAVTHINCAPSAFYPLIEDHQDYNTLSSLRSVIFGGESIQCERMAKWFLSPDCKAQLINNYGPTECTDIAGFYRVSDVAEFLQKTIPIGKPNDNVKSFIFNPMQQLLPAGVIGEICISGMGVGRGYLDNPELTREKFIPNPLGEDLLYRTGDLAYLLPDGNIQFHVREDFQIKLNGLRIELGEIESAIRSSFNIADALAMVIDNQLVAYAITNTASLLSNEWKQLLAKSLPAYMIPQSLTLLPKWPLTPNGKVDRNALPAPDNMAGNILYVAPRDDIEQVICDIIRRILGIDRVGIHDNFFDLGGHSLAASRAIVQIREHFQIDIPLNVLFEMTTVEKLAAYIKASQWALASASNTQEDDNNRDVGFI